MLIQRAELEGGRIADVRVERGIVTAIGNLTATGSEPILDARRGLLLPGLHDHHIHVAALAASLDSVRCGPPDVTDIDGFAACLQVPGKGWLRATGYHESVAGELDYAALDRIAPDRPLRVQHRSGRMWYFNSAGLEAVLAGGNAALGLDPATGRLFDEDAWLRRVLLSRPPSFARVGSMLAQAGVTGLTDMSPANDAFIAQHFAAEHESDALSQTVLLAGCRELAASDMGRGMTLGPAKLHLHEADLPLFDDAVAFVHHAHGKARAVAIHCATEVELVFALAVLDEAGTERGDRIEHASVAPDTAVEEIARLGLAVVSQPHFIAERGDAYRADVESRSVPLLYRLRAFLNAGVPLAGGSDAPFGRADPWEAMAAALSRRTSAGVSIGADESLTPEQALDLYLCAPQALDRRRWVEVGAAADLCLLDCGWDRARTTLSSDRVRATFVAGRTIYDRVDQAPV